MNIIMKMQEIIFFYENKTHASRTLTNNDTDFLHKFHIHNIPLEPNLKKSPCLECVICLEYVKLSDLMDQLQGLLTIEIDHYLILILNQLSQNYKGHKYFPIQSFTTYK